MEEQCKEDILSLTDPVLLVKEAKERVTKFGIKDWMICSCPTCNTKLDANSIIEFGVIFTPQFLGDLSFSYLCPKCYSAFVWHIKCNINNMNDLMNVFSETTCKYEMQYQHVLMENHRNNIIEAKLRK